MEWLSQNWLWIVLAIGGFYFMTRMGGCGMGGAGGHNRHHHADSDALPPAANTQTGNLVDPVSGRGFMATGTPISTVYRGLAYYFETRENRDAFEADPEKYLTASPGAGTQVGPESQYGQRQHRHHGC